MLQLSTYPRLALQFLEICNSKALRVNNGQLAGINSGLTLSRSAALGEGDFQ